MNMIYAVVGAVFMLAMAVFAFLKGDKSEKNGAGAYLLAWFASLVMQENGPVIHDAPIGVFLIDLIMLGVFAALAWRSKRSWPVWAAAIQLVTVMSHILILTNAHTSRTSLYTVMNLNGYLIIACLAVGVFWAWQNRKAAGFE
ncbi:hypothetical protein [Brevundimonas sp. SORGH_AS_0993]|uniref:hypothetical protein n=1 Tax=Brevundimonas sp. SORGH_AS_0993 TaxID=3041794 RepID=UPI00278B3F7D|nr:hypothetical protein [Brevundimonas sp. SORGH_AS_0993]MDQ1152989.1 hypothetical protein [Brevundimonas sp. SORGH_AS_0993]